METRLRRWVGVGCLLIGSVAFLAQGVVTPVSPGGNAVDQIADAASDLSAMRWALLFDAPMLLLIPAALFVGVIAGARRRRLAAVGAGAAFMGLVAAVFILANDILLYVAAQMDDPAAAGLVERYQENALFAAMLVLYLVGHLVGFVLLGVALWRERVVPRWAAVAVGAFPVAALVFVPAGGVLAVAGFAACAVALVRRDRPLVSAESSAALAAAER